MHTQTKGRRTAVGGYNYLSGIEASSSCKTAPVRYVYTYVCTCCIVHSAMLLVWESYYIHTLYTKQIENIQILCLLEGEKRYRRMYIKIHTHMTVQIWRLWWMLCCLGQLMAGCNMTYESKPKCGCASCSNWIYWPFATLCFISGLPHARDLLSSWQRYLKVSNLLFIL